MCTTITVFPALKARSSTVASIILRKCSADSTAASPKPFDAIPGPRGPLGFGNLYQYIPGIGKYSFDALHECGIDKYKKYGSIVRETMVPGHDVVWLYDPNDIATVLNDRTPGHYPARRSHLALAKYRRDRPNVYRTAGLLASNGSEWWRIRSELQKGLSSPQSIRYFLPLVDQVTKEFVANIKPNEKDDDVADFMVAISRLNLELTCLVAFDARLDSFSDKQMLPNSLSSRLMEAAEVTNQNIMPTDQGFHWWKLFETPSYRKLRKAQEFMEKTAVELVSRKHQYFNEDRQKMASSQQKPNSLLEQYLKNPNLELTDIIGMAADLLLAGVHTTAYTTSFILYHLCLNPQVQTKLFQEAKRILPDPSVNSVDEEAINSGASYCRAVLKETLRLNPISVGVGRILNRDTILGGYLVPKDTIVITQNQISCRQEHYFKNPAQFLPERWVRATKEKVNPYLVLPFGHGMRACIARRMAEQNMLVLMLRLIRSFELEWAGSIPMDIQTKLINQPDQPIKVRFRARPSSD